jgi:hypothetical protein
MLVFVGKSPNKIPTWYSSRSTAIILQRSTRLPPLRGDPALRTLVTGRAVPICIHGYLGKAPSYLSRSR